MAVCFGLKTPTATAVARLSLLLLFSTQSQPVANLINRSAAVPRDGTKLYVYVAIRYILACNLSLSLRTNYVNNAQFRVDRSALLLFLSCSLSLSLQDQEISIVCIASPSVLSLNVLSV